MIKSKHIEHYAISSDFFARCGIIHHTRSMLGNTMCGREFIMNSMHRPVMSPTSPNSIITSPKSSGFRMFQYLDMLFPTSSLNRCILNERVTVDMNTAEKREFTAQGVSMQLKGIGRRTPSGNTVDTPMPDMGTPMSKSQSRKVEKRERKGAQMMMGSESIELARKCAKECQGKTVRQLSRLWTYAGGARPVAEGVAIENGVGLGLDGMMA